MQAKRGCLVIHGFLGSTDDVKPLVDHLAGIPGLAVKCPTLPGHGNNQNELPRVTYHDWIGCAEMNLRELRKTCDKVSLVGFSMGGLIAVNLAVRHEIDRLALLNTPVYVGNIRRIAFNVLEDLRRGDLANLRRYRRGAALRPPVRTLVRALGNFLDLLRTTKGLFPMVACPTFIGQSEKDDTVLPKSAGFIFRNISSKEKVHMRYPDSGHVILHEPDRDATIADVTAFLTSADVLIKAACPGSTDGQSYMSRLN
ncbi:MAG: alpha/beta hydrolase [Bacillota bacterium]